MAGRVTVDGQVVSLLGTQVDPTRCAIAVDGVPIRLPTHRTLMLHKPAGVITTRSDPHARDTVMALLPDIPGLHPIGRLDKETTGLLLFTNDGDLTYVLTHPKHHVDKTYRAWVEGLPEHEALSQLRAGILLEDGLTAPAEVKRVLTREGRALLDIIIHEGRKRQVRRMLQAVGHPVISLSRTHLGPLTLGDLAESQWRELTEDEVRALYQAAGVNA